MKAKSNEKDVAEKGLVGSKITVMPSKIHGRGVFATETIYPGEIIEQCHVIVFKRSAQEVANYTFEWGRDHCALPLGYGCIYNHCDKPNCYLTAKFDQQLMYVTASQTIKPGEEIFCNYEKAWFTQRGIVEKKPFSWKAFFLDGLPAGSAFIYGILTLIALFCLI